MNIRKDIIVEGNHKNRMLVDLYYKKTEELQPIVVFCHGFKGYKDWGDWHLFAQKFVEDGFAFVKFNFSHNGTTLNNPTAFDDLEAFGNNNYTKELQDADAVISWILSTKNNTNLNIDRSGVFLIGHSRGGGVALIRAAMDSRIKRLALWASVDSLAFAWEEQTDLIEEWRSTGVIHIMNGRTKQQMPLYFQLYEDFEKNQKLYTIQESAPSIKQATIILHGSQDPAVPFKAAERLLSWLPNAKLQIIDQANHVFGASEPSIAKQLSTHSKIVFDLTSDFFEHNCPVIVK